MLLQIAVHFHRVVLQVTHPINKAGEYRHQEDEESKPTMTPDAETIIQMATEPITVPVSESVTDATTQTISEPNEQKYCFFFFFYWLKHIS